MYIGKVELENIRGFGSGEQGVRLDLRRPDGRYAGWTVLAGRNGSGKSTFLKAVALAVAGPFVSRNLQKSFAAWIRQGQEKATVLVELVFEGVDGFQGVGENPQLPLAARFEWTTSKPGPEPRFGFPLQTLELGMGGSVSFRFGDSPLLRGPWNENLTGWFVAAYGPHRRLSEHTVDTSQSLSGPLAVSRLISLFREDVSLVDGVQWLKELHVRRLEGKKGARTLLEGVLRFVNDNLLPDEIKIDDVDSDGLWLRRRRVLLHLRDMSDGLRNVVAFVLDLIRQLHVAYAGFEFSQQDGRWCVVCPGVVLIDEVELHLHLSWQRRIGFWLKEHFPNIQFIVTTHSPFVCQAADPKGLIRLPAPGEKRTAEHVSEELYKTVVNGTVDEAALTELFGLEHVHSDKSERLREQVAQLEARVVEGEATSEDREELKRLAAQLPDTSSALVDRAVRKYGLDK